jgi:hypothetical protein
VPYRPPDDICDDPRCLNCRCADEKHSPPEGLQVPQGAPLVWVCPSCNEATRLYPPSPIHYAA